MAKSFNSKRFFRWLLGLSLAAIGIGALLALSHQDFLTIKYYEVQLERADFESKKSAARKLLALGDEGTDVLHAALYSDDSDTVFAILETVAENWKEARPKSEFSSTVREFMRTAKDTILHDPRYTSVTFRMNVVLVSRSWKNHFDRQNDPQRDHEYPPHLQPTNDAIFYNGALERSSKR